LSSDDFRQLTPQQRAAMRELQSRSGIPWPEFLAQAIRPAGPFPYVGIRDFHGMFVGIEPDGFTHS